jgi:DNA-binding GntR family transcriptional regulator
VQFRAVKLASRIQGLLWQGPIRGRSVYPPPQPEPTKLTRARFGAVIAEALRNDILFGRIESGRRLSQIELCERFGTSRMPVRDALRQLSYEGFLMDDGKGHAVVAPVTREILEEIYYIAGMVCGLAANRAATRIEPDELAELHVLHERMCDAAARHDMAEMSETNWLFHRRINQLAKSQRIMAVLRAHTSIMPRSFLAEFPQWAEPSNHDHAELLVAFARRDAAEAEHLMKDHIVRSGHDLIRQMEAHHSQTVPQRTAS